VRRPTLTNRLKVLERDGWITRYPDATDGRKKLIALSQQGRDRFPGIMEDHFHRIGHAFGAPLLFDNPRSWSHSSCSSG